jgi:cyclase
MLKTRVIPCLLLHDSGLVKTQKFKNPKYLGDPINIVRIFNEKEVDEIAFLDITATLKKKPPSFTKIEGIAGECFMPLSYGGGIRSLEDIKKIISSGVEKVIINSYAIENPSFINSASKIFGSQSIVVSIDVKKDIFGKYKVISCSGKKNSNLDPVKHAIRMNKMGAGELLLNSIDRDGTMQGYDIDLLRKVSDAVTIPVIACGGAGRVTDFGEGVREGRASAKSVTLPAPPHAITGIVTASDTFLSKSMS